MAASPQYRRNIEGALGTVRENDLRPRLTVAARLRTLAAIIGPGLIVMAGDNDAGAFATYTQAGQDFGTVPLWTLLFLFPVLYVNQEMALRLGVVTRVGHAELIFARFGRFWGTFSLVDLVLLNGLTIVTEFIGISIGLDRLGVPRMLGVPLAAAMSLLAVATGSFRRFERFALLLCLGSLLLVPVLLMVHVPIAGPARTLLPAGMVHDRMADIMLLMVAIVGTTVAPWQLFFGQSYVIDKRITPRFLGYARADLLIGIVLVLFGAVAMVLVAAATFAGRPESGHYSDAGQMIAGVALYHGKLPSVLLALVLIDAGIIGAVSVSLSTAYAVGELLLPRPSLHRKVREAWGFQLFHAVLIVGAAVLVLLPGAPLGLITEAVQTLAGILLPSATVFLLLLCNDRAVLGPWCNDRHTTLFTGMVIAVLLLLSIVFIAAVLFPPLGTRGITTILVTGAVLATLAALPVLRSGSRIFPRPTMAAARRLAWRMPPLHILPPAILRRGARVWLLVLRLYLVLAVFLVVGRVAQLALR